MLLSFKVKTVIMDTAGGEKKLWGWLQALVAHAVIHITSDDPRILKSTSSGATLYSHYIWATPLVSGKRALIEGLKFHVNHEGKNGR